MEYLLNTLSDTAFNGVDGVWAIYSYDTEATPEYISKDVAKCVIWVASEGYGTIIFWPFNMEFKDAIEWFKKESKNYENVEEQQHEEAPKEPQGS